MLVKHNLIPTLRRHNKLHQETCGDYLTGLLVRLTRSEASKSYLLSPFRSRLLSCSTNASTGSAASRWHDQHINNNNIRLTAFFQDNPGNLFYWSKDDTGGGDYWSCNTCKAPFNSSPSTYQHPTFLQADASCCPINSVRAPKGEIIIFHRLAHPKFIWGSSILDLTSKGCTGYLGEGCQASQHPLKPVPCIKTAKLVNK